ncbi:GNAT family N-acetyltransferase (plasmid) [Deinococcus radiomollis]|uniref:GNAT family N-acetyltransferase n=1 Tax=Deinococcus radiomollis TaxID=468916 RepID=UPI0038919B05
MFQIEVRRLCADDYPGLSSWLGVNIDEIRSAAEAHHVQSRDHWIAHAGSEVVGGLSSWRSPDGRLRLYPDKCREDAWAPLLSRITGPAVACVNGRNVEALAALRQCGFLVARTELMYEIPVCTHQALFPAGYEVVSAADVSVEDVMALDCRLRDDVPGTEGWTEALEWFREENHGSPYFDPACYLIVRADHQHVALIRVWNGPRPLPRLGMVGVLSAYRGRGLATALLGQVLSVWSQRGGTVITAEVDQDNHASNALMTAFSGRVTGTEFELSRPS